MQLKQISVFLENKSGRLSRVTQILNQQRLWKNWKRPNLQFL